MKVIKFSLLALLVFDLLIIGYGVFLIVTPIKPFEITSPVKVINTQTIHPGDTVSYNYSFCKNKDVGASVSRVLDGPIDFPIAITYSKAASGCREARSTNILVPKDAPKGNYKVKVDIDYHVNPVRDTFRPVKFHYETQSFTVE